MPFHYFFSHYNFFAKVGVTFKLGKGLSTQGFAMKKGLKQVIQKHFDGEKKSGNKVWGHRGQ